MIRALVLVIAAVGVMAAGTARSAVIVVDFDSTPDTSGIAMHEENVAVLGVQFSPKNYLVMSEFYKPGDVMLGWAEALSSNPDYMGPACTDPSSTYPCSSIYVEVFGAPFSLLSFEYGGEPGFVQSSKGGYLSLAGTPFDAPLAYALEGEAWQDVAWVMFGGAACGPPCNFLDDVTIEAVPAPAVAWLLGPVFAGVVRWRGRRR